MLQKFEAQEWKSLLSKVTLADHLLSPPAGCRDSTGCGRWGRRMHLESCCNLKDAATSCFSPNTQGPQFGGPVLQPVTTAEVLVDLGLPRSWLTQGSGAQIPGLSVPIIAFHPRGPRSTKSQFLQAAEPDTTSHLELLSHTLNPRLRHQVLPTLPGTWCLWTQAASTISFLGQDLAGMGQVFYVP